MRFLARIVLRFLLRFVNKEIPFTNWIFSWANNGWKNSNKKTPENIDLIMKYYNMINNGYKVDFVKVEGHTGHKWNEYADKLATGRITPEQIEMIEREM